MLGLMKPNGCLTLLNKKTPPFYGWGSTTSRLEPLRGVSLLFSTQFPEMPDTHFIDLGRMKSWVELGVFRVILNTGTLYWESSILTTRPLLHILYKNLLQSTIYVSELILTPFSPFYIKYKKCNVKNLWKCI